MECLERARRVDQVLAKPAKPAKPVKPKKTKRGNSGNLQNGAKLPRKSAVKVKLESVAAPVLPQIVPHEWIKSKLDPNFHSMHLTLSPGHGNADIIIQISNSADINGPLKVKFTYLHAMENGGSYSNYIYLSPTGNESMKRAEVFLEALYQQRKQFSLPVAECSTDLEKMAQQIEEKFFAVVKEIALQVAAPMPVTSCPFAASQDLDKEALRSTSCDLVL